MSMLPAADRTKLVGILGMLGSDQDGERASAALLATRLLKRHDLRWDDIIVGRDTTAAASRSPGRALWHADLALAQRHVSYTRQWEQGFIHSVSSRHSLSAKQRAVLHEIAEALRARGLK